MLAHGTEILKYIPQRPPIVMVDTLFEASSSILKSSFTITADNLFIENNRFNESGLIENIAQTAALGIGFKQVSENLPVKLGYIAAIKKLEILKLPQIGNELITTIEVVNEVLEVTIVQGTVRINNEIAATCELRIFITN